jgi:DNA-binding NtrC family response regulator
VDRVGRFEAAHGGTLFLDEIGELPLDLQPKLLRALESREIFRVGANEPRRVNVRIVAATNRCLSREVDRGRFREDLYYRLCAVRVRLPPLRERSEDIPLLVRSLERDFRVGDNPPAPLSNAIVSRLKGQSWPGNIRELRNQVHLLLSLGPTAISEGEGDAAAAKPVAPATISVNLGDTLHEGEKELRRAYRKAYIERALQQAGGNVSKASLSAGVGRKFIQQAMKEYGLRAGSEDRPGTLSRRSR